ncbi:hypothetical protein NHX12_013093, partial [Muraenolepis orangiensis]
MEKSQEVLEVEHIHESPTDLLVDTSECFDVYDPTGRDLFWSRWREKRLKLLQGLRAWEAAPEVVPTPPLKWEDKRKMKEAVQKKQWEEKWSATHHFRLCLLHLRRIMKEEILEKARKQRDGLEENIQKIEEENRAEMEKKLKEIKLLKKEMREKKENGDKEMKMMKEEGWKCHRKVLDHEIEQLEEEERKQKVANTERIKLLRKEMRDKGEEAKSDLDFIKKEGWLTHKVSLGKEMKRLDEEERKEKATKQETTQLQKEEMRRNRERAKRDLKALNKDGRKLPAGRMRRPSLCILDMNAALTALISQRSERS